MFKPANRASLKPKLKIDFTSPHLTSRFDLRDPLLPHPPFPPTPYLLCRWPLSSTVSVLGHHLVLRHCSAPLMRPGARQGSRVQRSRQASTDTLFSPSTTTLLKYLYPLLRSEPSPLSPCMRLIASSSSSSSRPTPEQSRRREGDQQSIGHQRLAYLLSISVLSPPLPS